MSETAAYDTRTRHDQPRPVAGQTTLLDLEGVHVPANWVDPKQDLFIPNNPDHYEAHRLQLLLQHLDKQAQEKPGQFNSSNYISVLEKYTAICKQIKKDSAAGGEEDNDVLDKGDLEKSGNNGTTPKVGAGDAPGVGTRVSTDNPLAR